MNNQEHVPWRYRLMLAGLGVGLALGGWVDGTNAITWWHVLAVWVGVSVAFVATVWPHISDRMRYQVGYDYCPHCGGEGRMAFVTDTGKWAVTCHGYFWTLTDADLMDRAHQ